MDRHAGKGREDEGQCRLVSIDGDDSHGAHYAIAVMQQVARKRRILADLDSKVRRQVLYEGIRNQVKRSVPLRVGDDAVGVLRR